MVKNCFVGCCPCCVKRQAKEKTISLNDKQFKEAERKFKKSLDVTNLLKSVQKSDVIQNATLTRD